MSPTFTGVYLIHFHEPYKQARHYLGWSVNIARRLVLHRKGSNASVPLMRAVKESGITWELAATWAGDRHLERALRDRHDNPALCPLCRESRATWAAARAAAADESTDLPF